MATLDDKLLGEKLHYYCSSSEDEGEADSGDEDERGGAGGSKEPVTKFYPTVKDGEGGHNTGPKGVLSDWRRYKQLETEKREDAEAEKMALAKKLCLNARTNDEDEKAKAKDEQIDAELEGLLDDDFLESYMARRMREMMAQTNQTKKFGKTIILPDADSFLDQIDGEDKSVTVIIMIHEPGAEGCEAMTGCIECLAADFPTVKFCSIKSTTAGLSKHFKTGGVPALLVYKGGQVSLDVPSDRSYFRCQMLGSFVRMTDQLGTDFFAADVESILMEHGLLPDKEAVPSIIRGPANDEDSDVE